MVLFFGRNRLVFYQDFTDGADTAARAFIVYLEELEGRATADAHAATHTLASIRNIGAGYGLPVGITKIHIHRVKHIGITLPYRRHGAATPFRQAACFVVPAMSASDIPGFPSVYGVDRAA